MNEWFKKTAEKLKGMWASWKLPQKLAVLGVALALIVGVIIIASLSKAPTQLRLINTPIRNDDELRLITNRLDKEGIAFTLGEGNVIYVKDDKTRARANSVLIANDLIPKEADPWSVFAIDRFTVTEFERNVNLRNSIIKEVTRHIESVSDIDKANVVIEVPADKLFEADQKPVTASVILYPRPGSDITTNRKKLEGIQKIIEFAVSGLKPENIVITDQNGLQLNDFAGLEDFDRIERTKREQQIIQRQEAYYRAAILKALQQTYTQDRVRDLNIKIEMDMSKKNIKTEEHFAFTLKPDNPLTPYDDSIMQESVTLSSEHITEKYRGTAFNPEGPAGAEGQTPPAYNDLQNMQGMSEKIIDKKNQKINTRNIDEDYSPNIKRVTVSVNIDGLWKWKYNDLGEPTVLVGGSIERSYVPLTKTELDETTALVRDAIGFDRMRGDSVTVRNIQFDRTNQFRAEDAAYIRQQRINKIILFSLIGLAVLLVAFITFRLISREIERRRRIAEEKRALEQQLLRDRAIHDAEQEGETVSISIEERKRLDLQEHAINMAKEHPEDVAQLIRTWLREE